MGQRRLQQKINKQKLSLRSKVGGFKKDLLVADFFFESSTSLATFTLWMQLVEFSAPEPNVSLGGNSILQILEANKD